MIFVLANACAAWTAYTFNPGFMSYDSLIQYKQVVGEVALNDAHPVIMVYLWRALIAVFEYPGILLAFHQVFYWSTIALFSCSVASSPALRVAIVLLLGLNPPLYITSLHIWKDVGMMNALALGAVGCLIYAQRPHWGWVIMAASSFFYAFAVRINGFIPVIPMLMFLCFLVAKNKKPSKINSVTAALILTAVVLTIQLSMLKMINLKAERSYGLGTLIVWDMVSISLKTNKNLMPNYLQRAPSSDFMADLARNNSAEANYPVYKIVSPYPAPSDRATLLRDWISAIAQHPLAYLSHRAHVFSVLMGLGKREIYYPYHPGIDENEFQLQFKNLSSTEVSACFRIFDRFVRSKIYRPWLYFLLLLGATFTAVWRLAAERGQVVNNSFVLAVSISGLANLAALFFLATAADYRYTTWSIFAALIAACALLADLATKR